MFIKTFKNAHDCFKKAFAVQFGSYVILGMIKQTLQERRNDAVKPDHHTGKKSILHPQNSRVLSGAPDLGQTKDPCVISS